MAAESQEPYNPNEYLDFKFGRFLLAANRSFANPTRRSVFHPYAINCQQMITKAPDLFHGDDYFPLVMYTATHYKIGIETLGSIKYFSTRHNKLLTDHGEHLYFQAEMGPDLNGISYLNIKAKGANGSRIRDFSGTKFLNSAIEHFSQFFDIQYLIGDWHTGSDNFAQYNFNIQSGRDSFDAAVNTWNGTVAVNLGFTSIKCLNDYPAKKTFKFEKP